jgi:serine phosphatase RsbU (regulator of sigma subunit)/PAS domain-containing protein
MLLHLHTKVMACASGGVAVSMTGEAGRTAAGQQSIPRPVAGRAAATPLERLRHARQKPAQVLVPNGKTGSWDGYQATGIGAWEWYLASGVLCLDQTSMALLGVDLDTFDGRIETWINHVHPDDIAWVTAEVDKAISTLGPYQAEYRVCLPDGSTRWVQVRGEVESDADGNPFRMLGTGWDTTQARTSSDGLRSAMRYMSDGFLSVGKDWRVTFANVEAERLLNSQRDLTGRLLWDLLMIRRVPGLEARCREAAAGTTPASFEVEWPDTRRWYRLRLVPVSEGLAWYFTDITESRLRQAEQKATERTAAKRAARIQDLASALAEAVTSLDIVAAVADRVLPPFGASGLIIQVVEDGRMRTVGAVGYSQPFLDLINGPVPDLTPAADVLGRRRPSFISSAAEYQRRYPATAYVLALCGKQAWAYLPLVVSGRVVGLCVVSFDQPRLLSGAERALMSTLSALIAQALERARLFDAEHARSQALQRALLPRQLPELPAVTAAAKYLPAGRGMDVGGDWYDVIPLSADRVALVIGDVMGHGLPEAVIMGRVRTALQTLSDLELPPDEVLAHLNDLVCGLGDDSFVTCLYAIYDPTTSSCTVARAGHPPPAVVCPDGSVQFAQADGDPPLGVAGPPFEVSELRVPDGAVLVLYTDGLIDSTSCDPAVGMDRMAGLLRTLQAEDLDRMCDSLTRKLLPDDQQQADDAALLVARVRATAPDAVATWPLPEDPRAAGAARRLVRDQLAAWRLEELTMTTELVVSELVANVIRHARGPYRLRLLRSQSLVCEVFDGSLTTPRPRRASWTDEGGRGLQLVAALCDRWGTRNVSTGKVIWTEQSLPARLRLPLPVPAPRATASRFGPHRQRIRRQRHGERVQQERDQRVVPAQRHKLHHPGVAEKAVCGIVRLLVQATMVT